MPIWSEVAIDYSAGLDIVDIIGGKIYTEDDAKKQPKCIKTRLVNRPRKIGCWVTTIEESEEALKWENLT